MSLSKQKSGYREYLRSPVAKVPRETTSRRRKLDMESNCCKNHTGDSVALGPPEQNVSQNQLSAGAVQFEDRNSSMYSDMFHLESLEKCGESHGESHESGFVCDEVDHILEDISYDGLDDSCINLEKIGDEWDLDIDIDLQEPFTFSDTDPISDAINLTFRDLAVLLVSLKVTFNLSGVAMNFVMKIISLTLPESKRQHLRNVNQLYSLFFRKEVVKKHFYCQHCSFFIGADINDPSLTPCPNCNKDASLNKYFIEVPLATELPSILERNWKYLDHRFTDKNSDSLIQDVYDGELYQHHFSPGGFLHDRNNISLLGNTDGVSIFKSSNVSVWPVYAVINELPPKYRFRRENKVLCGLWFGPTKPNFSTFFKPFTEELWTLCTDGFSVKIPEKEEYITCKALLLHMSCDSPAKCLFQDFMQYNAYYGCPYCLSPGEYDKEGHSHVYPYNANTENGFGKMRDHESTVELAKQARKNLEDGKKKFTEKGVNGVSWAFSMPSFDIINGMCLDYMHAVLLGVMKHLLNYLKRDILSKSDYEEVQKRLVNFTPPNNITRAPRPLDDLKHWKASEYRSFLLFYGPACFYGVLQTIYYDHFMLLSTAVWLLLQNGISAEDLEASTRHLQYFVYQMSTLYGSRSMTFSVHLLLHLPYSVKMNGPLWCHSCFFFEDFNSELRQFFHSSQHPDSQVVKAVCVTQCLPVMALQMTKGSEAEHLQRVMTSDRYKRDVRSNAMVTIETDSLQRLSSLKSLLLADNQVEIIQEGAFQHLEAMEELDLNNNRISSTIEDVNGAFTGLVKLKKLSLINNKIKTITKQAFTGLESLEILLLDSNNITSIQGNSFEPLIQLRQLSFNTTSLFCDCQLSWVPIWLRDNNFEHSVIAKCAHPNTVKGKSIFVVDSSEFKCDGQFLKPEIFLNPKTQVVLKGENITLNCSAASTEAQGSPTHFQWRKDDFVLTDVKTEDYAVRTGNLTHYTSKLHISKAQDVDSGKYHCVISNDYGSAYSKRANINVYVFPKFTKRPQNVTAKARTEATLVCAAEGQPKPTITWQKDGGFDHFPAAQERRMHVIPEDDHFYIVDVKAADEGIYSCIAKNEAGTIVANVTLTVLQTPSFVRPMEPKETRVGTTTVMECLAQGSPQPKLTWYHDGEPLVLSQRHFFTAEDRLLVIVETKISDAGEYTCEMSNTLGTIRGTSTLTVVTGVSRGDPEDGNESSGGGLDDESTSTGIIIIAVVCCVVGTSLVWVIIIYQTRKRQELYSATPTDETTLPGEVPSSGYMSSDKEGSYTHGIPVTSLPAYQYHEMQMKESGYESSSGRFRAARSAAIFPSDVDQDELHHSYNMIAGDGRYLEQSDENSLSSQEYPQSESDSLKSDGHSVNSSHSSQQQILTTFHPHAASQERLGTTFHPHAASQERLGTTFHPHTASQERLGTTFHPGAASREHLGTSRSRSCSANQIPCDNNINTDTDTVQCENTNKDNSVSSQTDDTLGDSCLPSYKEIIHPKVNLRCRKCGEENSHTDGHECKHNNPPVPPKPSRWRHTRHKEHSHFDRAQPPGISRSSSDIQDYMYEEDIPPPPPPPLVPCSGVYVRPEYSGNEGVYLTNGSPYVPYYHPVNTPCDCHLHYAPPPTHKHSRDHRQHTSKDVATNNFSVPHNQRLNGVVGCVHHHIGGVNPVWQGHAYTLPYMPTHQVPQRHAAPTKVSPRQQQTHHSASRHRETSAGQKLPKSPNANSPKTDSSNS